MTLINTTPNITPHAFNKNVDFSTGTIKGGEVQNKTFCGRIRSFFKGVRNVTFKLLPCLPRKWFYGLMSKNEYTTLKDKVGKIIESDMLAMLKAKEADGMFRVQPDYSLLNDIERNETDPNYFDKLKSVLSINLAHIYPRLLLKDLQCATQRIALHDANKLQLNISKGDVPSVKNFMIDCLKFENSRQKNNFNRTMGILSNIYRAAKEADSKKAQPYLIAQAMATHIFDNYLYSEENEMSLLEKTNEIKKQTDSQIALCQNILEIW